MNSARRSVLRQILPPDVGFGEHWPEMAVDPLTPKERSLVEGVGGRRLTTFQRGRHAARLALHDLGVDAAPVLHGSHGEPRWQPGIIGSITHCHGYAAAVVSASGTSRVLGVDAERDLPLAPGVLELISSPSERASLGIVHDGVSADRLLFSAKESVYKAWFPSTQRRLGFRDVELRFEADRRFSCWPLVEGTRRDGHEFASFSGRWAALDGVLVTLVDTAAFTDHVGAMREMARGVPASP